MRVRTNPLRHRHLRSLKDEAGQLLAIFVLLVLLVSEVCGYLVADESLQTAYWDGFDTYEVEDGNFTLQKALNSHQREMIEALGVRLEDLFYTTIHLQDGSRLRAFANRQGMNRACVMEGRLAQTTGEIAVDRMFAEKHGLAIGDSLSDGSKHWTITGLVALSDYSAQFENNNDSMFDVTQFGVSVVSSQEFQGFTESERTWCYAWRYDQQPQDEAEQKHRSDAFLVGLLEIVRPESYLPRYLNQSIRFAGDDMGGRNALFTVFYLVSIAIVAFVFATTSSDTIAKEAFVIGTLRASGFSRIELVRHYLAVPLLVTLAADACGVALGYTVMKEVHASLYYDIYSLPSYTTTANPAIFLKATALPLVLVLLIDGLMLWRYLALSPLRFLRRDLVQGVRHGVVHLSERIRFFSRFKMRVILQNVRSYLVLLAGVFLAELLLMYGLIVPDTYDHFQDTLRDSMLCEYQYLLTVPQGALEARGQMETLVRRYGFGKAVETSDPDVEKFMVHTLRIPAKGTYKGESVMVYGIEPDSRYIDLRLQPGEVYISSAYADKLRTGAGDEITLLEQYEDEAYQFAVQGVYEYDSTLALFMRREDVNELFGYDSDMFAGYFSNRTIADIPSRYIARIIDYDALSNISRQLRLSMNGLIQIVLVFSLVFFFIVLYVLTRIVVGKNLVPISMTKILGYYNGEINALYLYTTGVAAALCLLVALSPAQVALRWLYHTYTATQLHGWIPLYVNHWRLLEIVALGMVTFVVVSLLEVRRIKAIPMSEALKSAD